MADIELVIKMPEELYEKIQERKVNQYDIDDICQSVFEGKTLSKGHGRLFDERDIVNGNYEVIGNRIYELEPIIEADKESE